MPYAPVQGRKEPAEKDERTQVERLAEEGLSAPVREAAEKSLAGNAEQIHQFLTTGRHEAAAAAYRTKAVQLSSTGSTQTRAAAKEAIKAGTTQALVDFLDEGQFAAREADERTRAIQLSSSGGPEVQAAAKVALVGPPQVIRAFVQTGQYKAARQDRLTATHVAGVQQLIAEAAGVAATAQQNAHLANEHALRAEKAAEEARKAANAAQKSSAEADGYAKKAQESARQAEASAAQAAESARQARAAEADANNAATRAVRSATQAQSWANYARGSADQAWTAAGEARASATAAGKDAQAANKAADEAKQIVVDKQRKEAAEWRKLQEAWKKKFAEANASKEEDDDGWPDWAPGWLKKGAGAVKDGAETFADYATSILSNGDIWAGSFETLLGLGGIGLGASGDIGGGFLCATGVLCVAGAPAIVASTGVIIGGAYATADGVGRIDEGLGTALREARSKRAGSKGGGGSGQTPKIIHDNVKKVMNGERSQRRNPDGTPDFYEGRTSGPNKTPPSVLRKWKDAKIYDMGDGENNYRILVNNYGDIGWISEHNYNRVTIYDPKG
ncbi:ALF repeat-containing protein [Streptomyces chrestomyceticus]|uniref:ALF repeat-containing protein n=1 Tax=Streptomyces chrestomyceticus TaxID=68185 RepID=UPI0033D771C5